MLRQPPRKHERRVLVPSPVRRAVVDVDLIPLGDVALRLLSSAVALLLVEKSRGEEGRGKEARGKEGREGKRREGKRREEKRREEKKREVERREEERREEKRREEKRREEKRREEKKGSREKTIDSPAPSRASRSKCQSER